MTAPSCFALPLLIQTLGLEQAALFLYFIGRSEEHTSELQSH